MAITDPVKKWVFGIALAKGVKSLAKLLVSYFLAHGVSFVGAIGGVQIDTTSELAITAAINSALKMLFNWLKTRWPAKFGWL
jgi:hypothetical protein